jgi:electron transport complex protein RnfA
MSLRLLLEYALYAMLVNNIVLNRFLGICPAVGATKTIGSALGMGGAVTIVMTSSAVLCWVLDSLVLIPLSLTVLRLLVFLLTIAGFVQITELCLRKWNSRLCDALGIYLPLLASNCAILGIILITTLSINPVTGNPFSFLEMFVYCFFTGIGFTLVSLLFSGINLRVQGAPVAGALQGLPITLLSAGLVALAFCGFSSFTLIP